MAHVIPLVVTLIAKTEFMPPPAIDWETDATGGQALAEFAGRACYETWDKPNPRTATNAQYLHHIMQVGHLSLLEHGSVTFYITGMSRSCSHELIRHRHFSFSQLSQRFVLEDDVGVVIPPAIVNNPSAVKIFLEATDAARDSYRALRQKIEKDNSGEANGMLRRKQIRQAARSVLPNATETRLVVTGNYRAWRHFIGMRATEHADIEIRAVAIECLRQLQQEAPPLFDDFIISTLGDNSEIAASPYVVDE